MIKYFYSLCFTAFLLLLFSCGEEKVFSYGNAETFYISAFPVVLNDSVKTDSARISATALENGQVSISLSFACKKNEWARLSKMALRMPEAQKILSEKTEISISGKTVSSDKYKTDALSEITKLPEAASEFGYYELKTNEEILTKLPDTLTIEFFYVNAGKETNFTAKLPRKEHKSTPRNRLY